MKNAGKYLMYQYIFKDIFPFLYGKTMIQRNRLTLTDEDALEFKTFETMTLKVTNYMNSTVMLCIFNAIWKHFKENRTLYL